MRTRLFVVSAILTRPGDVPHSVEIMHYLGYRDAGSRDEAIGKMVRYLGELDEYKGYTLAGSSALEVNPIDIADMFELQQKQGAS